MVIGYDLVMRSISLRTETRVGTHFIGVPREGYSSASLCQLAFRFAGRTREVSHQCGCTSSDSLLAPQSE